MLINTNEKGSTAYAIEPYFLYKKKTIVQEGERNDGPPPATIATSEGDVTQFGELRDASCTLGSNEIH